MPYQAKLFVLGWYDTENEGHYTRVFTKIILLKDVVQYSLCKYVKIIFGCDGCRIL